MVLHVAHLSTYIHPWISMILAIFFELAGTINAKLSEGLTVIQNTCFMYVSYIFSVTFLALALDTSVHGGLDLGVAYATWSGLGTIVAAVAGVFLYGEKLSGMQYVGILLTIVGVTLINVTSPPADEPPKEDTPPDVEKLTANGHNQYGTL